MVRPRAATPKAGATPAEGGHKSLSDAEVKAAVDYMLEKVE